MAKRGSFVSFGASGKDRSVELTWKDPAPTSLSLSGTSEKLEAGAKRLSGTVLVPAWDIVTIRAERP